MNYVETNSAKLELLKQCSNITNKTLDFGVIKEVEFDDKIVVFTINPVVVNDAKITILDKNNRAGDYIPFSKRKVGYSAKGVAEKLINEFFKELEEKSLSIGD